MSEPGPAAASADSALAAVQDAYNFLELLQPTNTAQAWESFESSGFAAPPGFKYPQIDIDFDGLRRKIDGVEFDEVEDPGLLYFLESKREELRLELQLLSSRGTRGFLAESIRLYGPVQQSDIHEAELILERLHPDDAEGSGAEPKPTRVLGTDECRKMVEQELALYREKDPSFEGRIEERPDQDGFLAEKGVLIFPSDMSLPPERARALTQHEIGVHIVTYHNGTRQPLELLSRGLSSYDELQEAFGALAEHFAGGFTATRLRTLAGRLVAARMTEQEVHFVDVFRRLTRDHGFSAKAAFHITARVHQSGGFTRDQIYLRGLIYLLRYLEAAGPLQPLYIGKVGHREIPIIRELRRKEILREPPLRPRFLDMEGSEQKLRRIREGMEISELVNA